MGKRPTSRFVEPDEAVLDRDLSIVDEDTASEPAVQTMRPILRRRGLRQLMADANYTGDPHRFLRDEGLPAPRSRYRVTVRKGKEELEPVEVDAFDESDAARQALDLNGIILRERHQCLFVCVCVDE